MKVFTRLCVIYYEHDALLQCWKQGYLFVHDISQVKYLWFMKLTERTCLMHTFFIQNEKQCFYSVSIQTLQAKASRLFKMDSRL